MLLIGRFWKMRRFVIWRFVVGGVGVVGFGERKGGDVKCEGVPKKILIFIIIKDHFRAFS